MFSPRELVPGEIDTDPLSEFFGMPKRDAGLINLVITSAEITDALTVVHTANYASHRQYKGGDRWVALAAWRWPQVVEKECAEAQTRTLG
jgi:hypothetical protein